jgi:hypothetical protein
MQHKVTKFSNGVSKEPVAYVGLREALLDVSAVNKVLAYRKGLAGNMGKLSIPCIIPAGTFTGKTLKSFVSSSGILYVDIDPKDNSIPMAHIRKMLTTAGQCPWLYALQSSCSGNGLALFIRIPKIRSREVYRVYYKEVEEIFKRSGIVVDRSCVNINRQRYASVDAHTYFNEEAEVLRLVIKRKLVHPHTNVDVEIDNDLKEAIMASVVAIERDKYDMTEDYNTWLYVAGLFRKVFGEEQGRTLFHRISRFYPKYDKDETDTKYDHCAHFENASPRKFFRLITPKLKIK